MKVLSPWLLLPAVLAAPVDLMAAKIRVWPADKTNPCITDTERNPKLAAEACTAIIRSGKFSGTDLAVFLAQRADAYRNSGDIDLALKDWDAAIQLDPHSVDFLLSRGDILSRKSEYKAALADYDKAVRLQPGHVDAVFKRGVAHVRTGKPDQAILDFSTVIRLDPKDHVAYYSRGTVYNNQKVYDKAIADFDEALRLKPDDARSLGNRAAARYQTKDYLRSLIDLNRALQLNPADLNDLRNRGFVLSLLGQHAGARTDFAEALRPNPKDPYLALWLFLATARTDERQARAALERNSLALKADAWPAMAVDLYLGRVTPAQLESHAEKANVSHDERCEAYFYLGEHAVLAGNKARAQAFFEKAVATGVTHLVEFRAAEITLATTRSKALR